MKHVWVLADYSQAEARVVAWKGPVPVLRSWFQTGEDVHLNVAKMIGQVVQKNNIVMPNNLWQTKPWYQLVKSDPERQLSKNTVHGNNYDMGRVRFAYITGLPVKHAETVQNLYHGMLPEIRGNYHRKIIEELANGRTLHNPLGWKRTFYDIWGEELKRAAYAWYAQSTIGLKTVKLFSDVSLVFKKDIPEARVLTPEVIRSWGLDTQLQAHDSVGASVPDDRETIIYACKTIKRLGETPIMIDGEPLVVPMDFKVGYSWGEAKDFRWD